MELTFERPEDRFGELLAFQVQVEDEVPSFGKQDQVFGFLVHCKEFLLHVKIPLFLEIGQIDLVHVRATP